MASAGVSVFHSFLCASMPMTAGSGTSREMFLLSYQGNPNIILLLHSACVGTNPSFKNEIAEQATSKHKNRH